MGKKTKGKQKQEDKPTSSNEMPNSLPMAPDDLAMNADDDPSLSQSITQAPASAWGTSEVQDWGASAAETGGDSWAMGTHEQHDSWGRAESLLQPPPTHSHSILPAIRGQPSIGHYTQTGPALSDVGESQEEYSDYQRDTHSPQAWDPPQSQTLTATAAPSVINSPTPHPHVSLAEAAAVAEKDIQKQQKISTASEAARKLEESRVQLNKGHSTVAQSATVSPAVRFEDLNTQAHTVQTKPISVASAAAAAMESSMNKYKPAHVHPSDPPQPGKTYWTYPKPFLPNFKTPARIEPDPTWTTTGGNDWSRRQRQNPSASIANNWSQSKEDAWNQQINYLRQARDRARQTQSSHPAPVQQQQQRPNHFKHRSQPEHVTSHQQQQRRSQLPQNQSWQGWGRGDGDQDDESKIDEETLDGWGANVHQGDNDWTPAWAEQPLNTGKGRGKGETGRAHGRKPEEQWMQGQTNPLSQGAQDAHQKWDSGNNEWGQHGGQSNQSHGWGHTNDAWGQQAYSHDNNAWGRGVDSWGQADSGWGGKGDTGAGAGAWDKGASDSGFGKAPSESGWGKGMDTGQWGGGVNVSNGDWGTNAHVSQQAKVTFVSAEAAGTRNMVSPQQRSQILNSLLNLPQNQKSSNIEAAHKASQQASASTAKQAHEKTTVHHDNWGTTAWEAQDNGWGSVEDGDDDINEDNRRVHFSPKASDIWGGSPRSVPSKSLSQAHNGFKTTLINDASNVRFVESRGAAFDFVSEAFFGNARLARDRIHWLFPADKDERVANMLSWVQKMSFNLGTFGLLKFLEHKERGALFVNTIFRMHQHPSEPAFDYLTFNELQGTMDKTLQESVAFYDPARLVIVFVYLPSQTGHSVAIWRRKVHVPDIARIKYRAEVDAIIKTLRKDKEYVVMVDELPPKPKTVSQRQGQLRKSAPVKKNAKGARSKTQAGSEEKKRKWWKLFLS